MNLIELHEGKHFSVRVHADGVGADVNHLTGFVSLDSLTIHKGDEDYIIQQIALYSTDPDEQMLSLSSDFMEGSVRGDFTYESLYQSVLSHLHRYLPSVCSDCAQGHKHADNICTANFKIHTLKPLQEFLLMPVEIQQAVNIEGFINDHTQDFRLQAIVPQIDFNGMSLSNIGVRCEPSGNGLDAYVSGTQHADDAVSTSVNLLAHAQDDRVNLGLSWETTPEALFDGAFYAKVAFDLDEKGDLVAQVQSDSSHTTINHSQWMLYPFKADIATENISIRDFRFEHGGDQFLTIDGRIADNSADTLRVKVNNLDLNYLLTLVKPQGISFGGNVSGYVDLANLYSEAPYVDARINAEDFAFCNGLMGDAIAHAYWNQDSTRLDFVADVSEVPQRVSKVNGYADLADRKLRIDIDADSINVLFLNGLLKNFMSDVKGNASGNIVLPDEETERQMYYDTLRILSEYGYHRYEISNYAMEGHECRHNITYWRRGEYKGFGVGAASLLDNIRYANTSDMKEYLAGVKPVSEILTVEDCMAEFAFLGLRMMNGIDTEKFYGIFNRDFYDVYGDVVAEHTSKGLLNNEGSRIKLTEKGIDVSNYVFSDFLLT